MANSGAPTPTVVSQTEWEEARRALLAEEKAHTAARDRLNAARRRLPMYRIETGYVFEGPDGAVSLVDLFEGKRQLILVHFMFDPAWDEGCVGCSAFVDDLTHPAHLCARDTNLVLVSLAPYETLAAYRERMGWDLPWYSSAGSTFNVDFGVTSDEGELPGLSVFLSDGDDVYHTYFTTARGTEHVGSTYSLLDLTPYGRQEDWEDSPAGWPQSPTYGWRRRHDEYEN